MSAMTSTGWTYIYPRHRSPGPGRGHASSFMEGEGGGRFDAGEIRIFVAVVSGPGVYGYSCKLWALVCNSVQEIAVL